MAHAENRIATIDRTRLRPVVRVDAATSVLDASRLLYEWGSDAAVVVNGDGVVVGVFTVQDVVRVVALEIDPHTTRVGNCLLSPCKCGECPPGGEAWLG